MWLCADGRHEAVGSRVCDAQPDEHDELWGQQYPVSQRPPKCVLQSRVHTMSLAACSDMQAFGTSGSACRPTGQRGYEHHNELLSKAVRRYLGKLVVSVEPLPFMLVQDTQLPQRIQADDPCMSRVLLQR